MPHVTRAIAIAVLGTGSDVGKSLVVAGLCRLLHRAGIRVAPFKAQNMSLNSFVTPDGGEIGRAQALQAEACSLAPHVDMNPILLKPESDARAQVVVQGRVYSTLDARAYFTRGRNAELFQAVRSSYERLAAQYDVIVIEGAGSAAEVNLRDRDLVNWATVELADARVVLVGDIDRGGVFAQLIGTLDLIAPEERARVCGLVINKFRGDSALFADGVRFLRERTGIPVLGVLPFLRDLTLDQEDSLDVEVRRQVAFADDRVNIAVLLLPHMSNFTDFNLLTHEADVALRYVATPAEAAGADAVIIPGSKSTLADLAYLRGKGFDALVHDHVRSGRELVGICGGYQMLGNRITDPDGVETGGEANGLRLLQTHTIMRPEKVTEQVEASALHIDEAGPMSVRGYLIHMGRTDPGPHRPCFHLEGRPAQSVDQLQAGAPEGEALDGAVRDDGLVWGTYIHGLFDQPQFRRAWLNRLRRRKGIPPIEPARSQQVNDTQRHALDRWADHVEQHLDLTPIWAILRSRAGG
ncbi:MAG TPA: cobyric acid synthase [Nitrospira sp.]|jgi:adenosylcobyric acid synthase|nr:cobyric acid synthase [Nitrospira sp.]